MILPDREWIQLSNKIKIQCITNHLQDSVLLIDVCGKLFINLNDAGVKGCSNYIKKISKQYEHSFLLVLAGYGDADMINFFIHELLKFINKNNTSWKEAFAD